LWVGISGSVATFVILNFAKRSAKRRNERDREREIALFACIHTHANVNPQLKIIAQTKIVNLQFIFLWQIAQFPAPQLASHSRPKATTPKKNNLA
jgi:hypothetical protein